MSSDQKTLYKSCKAIIAGSCPPKLAKYTLGGVSHARWLTLAVRINFLFMATIEPSPELYRMAWFVINVYSLLWFSAKKDWRITKGACIAFKAMKLIKALPMNEYRVVAPTFERGFGYWLHSEQLFLACLASDCPDVRAQAVARILHIRHEKAASSTGPSTVTVAPTRRGRRPTKKSNVRTFEVPTPIYDAANFWTAINWNEEQITEPPYLRRHSDEQLRSFESQPLQMDISSNSQFVERFIQVITQNGTKAGTPTLRNGRSISTIRNRRKRPKIETKKDFVE